MLFLHVVYVFFAGMSLELGPGHVGPPKRFHFLARRAGRPAEDLLLLSITIMTITTTTTTIIIIIIIITILLLLLSSLSYHYAAGGSPDKDPDSMKTRERSSQFENSPSDKNKPSGKTQNHRITTIGSPLRGLGRHGAGARIAVAQWPFNG